MTPPRRPESRDSDGRFRTLASERRFEGTIASVRVDTVTMPGGGTATREVVEHLSAVAVVALDESGQVVLIEQYRHPLRRRLWELPAGLMDIPGESPLDCAERELYEETGLVAGRWSVLVDLATSPGFCTEAVRVFLATGIAAGGGRPASAMTDEESDLRVVRVPLEVAVDAVLRGEIVNASAVAGILAAAAARHPRPADAAWAASPAQVHRGDGIGGAPALASPDRD